MTNEVGLMIIDAIRDLIAANEDAAKWRAQRERTRERVRLVRVQTPSQEKESKKRDIPPTPPIERKPEVMESIVIKEKEDTHLARAYACRGRIGRRYRREANAALDTADCRRSCRVLHPTKEQRGRSTVFRFLRIEVLVHRQEQDARLAGRRAHLGTQQSTTRKPSYHH